MNNNIDNKLLPLKIDVPVISAQNLSKKFDDQVTVLSDVNINIFPGEWLSIVGSSGCGKSTLLHLLGGLEKPTSGTVFWRNSSIHDFSEKELAVKRNFSLGFIYQFHHLLREFTAQENVAISLKIRGVREETCQSAAQEILSRVGLSQRLGYFPSQLSGGERQRVAIARALVTQPECLLADEATGNLDGTNASKIMELLAELVRERSLSCVTVTHDVRLAEQSDRVLHLVDGRLLSDP